MSAAICLFRGARAERQPAHSSLANPEPIHQDPPLRGTNDNDLGKRQFKLTFLLLINQLATQTAAKSPPVRYFPPN